MSVNHRQLPVQRQAEGVIWFEFSAICDGPRSQNKYIEIARRYHTVLISNVPVMGGNIHEKKIAIGTEDSKDNTIGHVNRTLQSGHMDDQARRFIALVDEFYDSRVNLIVSAQGPIEKLYPGGRVSFDFQRTQSRLLKM